LIFPPINLWSKPYQKELDDIKFYVEYKEILEDIYTSDMKSVEANIREREYLYYLRSGRLYKDKAERLIRSNI